MPDGVDPAQLLTDHGELAVVEAVADGPDLARAVIDYRLAELLLKERVGEILNPPARA